MGYEKNITPNMDELALDGLLFTNAISNGGDTYHSIPSFLTSTSSPVNDKSSVTIAEYLKKYGYTTAAFNPNPIILAKMVVRRASN